MERSPALALLDQAFSEEPQKLARYAWGTLRNQGLAGADAALIQDILGDAVLTATQIIQSSDGRAPTTLAGLRLWLRKIISLKCLEHLRRLAKERSRRVSLSESIDELSSGEWLDFLERDELHAAVSTAVDHLHEREQQVLEMSLLDGATSNRIGDALGMRPDAVRKIKMQALRRLRKYVERLGV